MVMPANDIDYDDDDAGTYGVDEDDDSGYAADDQNFHLCHDCYIFKLKLQLHYLNLDLNLMGHLVQMKKKNSSIFFRPLYVECNVPTFV